MTGALQDLRLCDTIAEYHKDFTMMERQGWIVQNIHKGFLKITAKRTGYVLSWRLLQNLRIQDMHLDTLQDHLHVAQLLHLRASAIVQRQELGGHDVAGHVC